MAGAYTINNIYQGSYSSIDPNSAYGSIFTGYNVPAAELGAPTKPDTANQIQQVNTLLNQGIVPIEVGALNPDVFEQIPKQHFKEINRMAKLAGGKLTVHAPLIEPSGIGEQGWSEANREMAENRLLDVIKKSTELDNKGGIPVTIHSANIGGSEYGIGPDGKKKVQKLAVINQETGQTTAIKEEEKYYPGVGKIILQPEEEIETYNHSEWTNSVSELVHFKENADRIINENYPKIQHLVEDLETGKKDLQSLNEEEREAYRHITNARTYLDDSKLKITGMFNRAYKYGDKTTKEVLDHVGKQYREGLKKLGDLNVKGQSQLIQDVIEVLRIERMAPEVFVPVENFALDKSSETFANVAVKAYKDLGDKSPTLSIENLYPGLAFSIHPDDEKGPPGMNELILESKSKFVEKAIMPEDKGGLGMSRSAAERQADKMIGMTFDVGHLNIARKHGFQEKHLVEEVAKIAKHVKHVHLTDNFGYADSHLPPGMGNVPIKEMLAELEKAGTLKDALKVVEAGGWVQHFQSSPLPYTLQGMGAPITTEDTGPYWLQAPGLYQSYSGGFGMMLPGINYQTFGAGFSRLPQELGGQVQGAQGGRMSGTPME